METVFEHTQNSTTWTVSTNERLYKNQLARLAKAHPDDVRMIAQNKDGSVLYHIPASWLRVRPPRKCVMPPEQRAAVAERLKASRGS